MLDSFKRKFYFPIASYFKFFAWIRLRRWNPTVVVVTGSQGKTTLLELIKAGMGARAKYSDHANSAYGIPFDILGLHRKTFSLSEWFDLIIKTPFAAFKKPPLEKIYIVEADCDRPNEGKFLASLLVPNITLWLSTGSAHGANYEHLVGHGFDSVEKAIAHEYGYFLEYARESAVINGDSELQKIQSKRSKVKIHEITEKQLSNYKVYASKTEFVIDNKKIEIDALLVRENFYSIAMANILFEYLGAKNISFKNFKLPPGRSSVFQGIKNTILIDSSYNAPPDGFLAILEMFKNYNLGSKKWIVAGDMLELGRESEKKHKKIAEKIISLSPEKVLLLGKFTADYILPYLVDKMENGKVIHFENHAALLEYIKKNLEGRETLLFKGAAGMQLEFIIEKLLAKEADIKKLPRRGKFYEEKRRKLLS